MNERVTGVDRSRTVKQNTITKGQLSKRRDRLLIMLFVELRPYVLVEETFRCIVPVRKPTRSRENIYKTTISI